MNTQTSVPSVTLQTAVLMQVKEFATSNTSFSVHDITVALRQKTQNGELEIPEVEVNGGSFRFNIEHSKVKALFDELWRNGVFDPDFSLTRQFNNMYFEYTPTLNSTVSPTVSAPAAPVSFASTPVVAATSPATSNKIVSKGDVIDRINLYLENCADRSFQPSLKQVQSAIKRGDVSTGWTCESIRDIIVDDLGYTVVDNPDHLSSAQVVV